MVVTTLFQKTKKVCCSSFPIQSGNTLCCLLSADQTRSLATMLVAYIPAVSTPFSRRSSSEVIFDVLTKQGGAATWAGKEICTGRLLICTVHRISGINFPQDQGQRMTQTSVGISFGRTKIKYIYVLISLFLWGISLRELFMRSSRRCMTPFLCRVWRSFLLGG